MLKGLFKSYNTVKQCKVLANSGQSFIRKPLRVKINPQSFKYDSTTLKSVKLQNTKSDNEISEYFYNFILSSFNPRKPIFKRPSIKTSLHLQAGAYEGYCRSLNSKVKVVKNYKGNICGGYSSNVDGQDLYISSLYLNPEAKSKTLALDLLEDIKTTAQQNGCKSIVCDTGHVKEFQKLGFEEVNQQGFMKFLQWITKSKKMSCPTENFATRYLT